MQPELEITGFNNERKIQAIKVIRAVTKLGLKESKEIIDGLDYDKQPRRIKIAEGWNAIGAVAHLAEGYVEAHEADFGDIEDDTPPLPITSLALKLAMDGLSIEQVVALAKALNGIEDATGSLMGAARLMKEVA